MAWIDQSGAECPRIGWLRATDDSGRLTALAPTAPTNTEDYGVGAFLLACSEIELLATNGPALGLWAGADQTLINTNPAMPEPLTLDGSQTEIYRGPAGTFTWWEGANQIATGTKAQISLSAGQHVIVLQVPGVDGITYTDSMTVTVITQAPPALALQFDFEDSGTTTTDSVAGVGLRLVNASGAPTDLHGGVGSGVGGYGKALNFNATSMGGTGPMAFTTNNTTIAFGTLNAFTLTLWIKPASSLLVNGYPRFFTLGTNGITDRGVPGSLQLLADGIAQPTTTSVQAFVNTLGTSGSAFGTFNMPANQWSFLALTYDGSTLNFYGGSETNPVALQSSTPFAAGPVTLTGAWTLMLGNRLARDRAFSGQLDAVRFYAGACSLPTVESIRSAAVAPNAFRITPDGSPTAGSPYALTIRAVDQYQNTVTSVTGDHSFTFAGLAAADDGTYPTITDKDGNAVNLGTATTITFTNGVSSAGGILLAYKAETATLTGSDATSGGTTSGTGGAGANLTVLPALASKLAFGVQPSTTTAGLVISPSVMVTVEDKYGNPLTSDSSTVTIGSTTTAFASGSSLSVAAASGVATFSNLKPTTAGRANTLTASDGEGSGLTAATSSTFTVNPGAVSQLVMNPTTISSATAGTSVSSSFTSITAKDAYGNVCGSGPNAFTGPVSFGGTAGATGTSGVFSAGVLSSFPTLTPTVAGSGKTVTATSGSVVGTTTLTTVNPGAVSQLVMNPTTISLATAGTSVSGSFASITAKDAYGNVCGSGPNAFTGPVSFGGTAGATGTSGAFSAGVLSTFPTLTPTVAGSGKTVTATSGSVVGTTTLTTVNPGAVSQLVMNPTTISSATAGTSVSGSFASITAEDAYGNVCGSGPNAFTGPVSFGGTAGATGTSGVFSAGVLSSFPTLTPTVAGSGKTVTATAGSVVGTTTLTTVNPGAMSQLVMNPTTISSATAGTSVSSSFTSITAKDAYGNVCGSGPNAFTGPVSFGGTAGATGTSGAFSAGVLSSFPALTPTVAGSGKTVTAISGLVVGTTTLTTVNPGAVSQLVMNPTTISSATAGTSVSSSFTSITAKDAYGNVCGSGPNAFTGPVSFGGTAGATGTSGAFSAGVLSSFPALTPTAAGSGKTVTATSGSVVGTTTLTTVNPGAVSQLVMNPTTISSATAGTSVSSSFTSITAKDAYGNVCGSGPNAFTGPVSFGGTAGATGTSGAFSAGVLSSFPALTPTVAGSGKTVTATSGSVAGTTTLTTVNPGPASKLAFTTEPGGGTGGTAWTTQPAVTLQDQFGNTVAGTAQDVTLVIQDNPGSGTLSGAKTVAVDTGTGVATFSGLSIDEIGTGYTLTATGTTVDTSAGTVISSPFDVTLGAANAYTITDAASGSPTAGVGDQLTITLVDAGGNTITSFDGDKNLTFSGLSKADDGTHPTVTDKSGTAQNLGATTTITFIGGVANGVSPEVGGVLTAYKAETQTLNVQDDASTPLSSTSPGGAGVSLTIAKANPNVTVWPTASAITYGQTLAASTLSGGSATPVGSFAFTTPSTAPKAGTALQSVTYTPTDTADYNTASSTVSVTVNKADAERDGLADGQCDHLRPDPGRLDLERRLGDPGGQLRLHHAFDRAQSWDSPAERDLHADRHGRLQHRQQHGERDGEQGRSERDGLADGQCDHLRPDPGRLHLERRFGDPGGQLRLHHAFDCAQRRDSLAERDLHADRHGRLQHRQQHRQRDGEFQGADGEGHYGQQQSL